MIWNPRAPRPQSRGQRPQIWKTGPDPVLHKKYLTWLQQRNQAQWRDEGWSIGFEDWCALWAERWESRGRQRGDYCMTRIDWSLPWTLDNVHVITREAHAKAQGDARAAGWSSIAQKRRRGRKRQGELDFGSDDQI
ncbi:hypothetical protein UFOVP327_6 [uncultured Caudovirales phage]|uniref:Uncharacterized protein n=1 Tax=uncultured Caudovirales phage TaxID=2100421 RepID=A0A6J5LRR2_9CAUD|nr:hypothetical protein UFOVP327_6 [uncultured Caudovirales phage]